MLLDNLLTLQSFFLLINLRIKRWTSELKEYYLLGRTLSCSWASVACSGHQSLIYRGILKALAHQLLLSSARVFFFISINLGHIHITGIYRDYSKDGLAFH